MNSWTNEELELLKKYDNESNEYAGTPDIVKDSETLQDILMLEAKLHSINKPVIGYTENEPVGIFSFIEATEKEQYYIKQGKIFTYHPINFHSMKEYASYLNAK